MSEQLPVMYLRPTKDADYFLTMDEAEAAIPDILANAGKFFGFMYVYLDMEVKV